MIAAGPKKRSDAKSTGRAKRVTILGSTGSVGLNTLEVIRRNPGAFRVAGLSAGSNGDLLDAQIREFCPEAVYLKDPQGAAKLRARHPELKVFNEHEKIHAFAAYLDSDILMAASAGTSALLSVLDAIKNGKRVALANKEILVMAGSLVMRALKQASAGARHLPAGRQVPAPLLIPVDSEHSAIFQCLLGSDPSDVEKLILTGSGGPLHHVAGAHFSKLLKEDVIRHPKWKMGKKISVDSATLMNKGLEIIEASWIFNLPVEKIEVLIHPEAVIHSMVEFKDGSILAQLGVTDMKLPIQFALSHPRRLASPKTWKLDLAKIGAFHFLPPDRRKFPCLQLAYDAAKSSGSAPCVLSAADEVAVEAYLSDKIPFVDIPKIIENVLSHHRHVADPNLDEIQSVHRWATEETKKLCKVL